LLRLVLVSAIGLSLGLAGMGLAPAVAWVLPAVLAGGACNGLLNLAIGSLVGMRSAEAVRGRVAAIVGGLASAGQVGAMLLGGLLATALEPRQIFVLAGLLGLLAPLGLAHRLLASAEQPVTLPVAEQPGAEPPGAVPALAVAAAAPHRPRLPRLTPERPRTRRTSKRWVEPRRTRQAPDPP
jgi:MFS family permease